MKFQLLHRAVKDTPVVSLNTVTRVVHIQLLARQIHNTHILPTAAASRPAQRLVLLQPPTPSLSSATKIDLLYIHVNVD
jgi:hypothetical protein